MVDVMGHVAMGLLWALPAWLAWRDRVAAAFIGLTVLTAPIPDVDIYLSQLFPAAVHHHGVTHTVVFSVLVSVVGGAIVAVALTGPINRWLGTHRFDTGGLFVFTAGAFLLGSLSHLFADMLSAPDIASPIEPFWPFFDKPWSIDVAWYNDPLWNVGLLTAAVILHLIVAYVSTPVEHPYRTKRA